MKPEYDINNVVDALSLIIGFPFGLRRGLRYVRFYEILNGKQPDKEEQSIINWAYNIGSIIVKTMTIKDYKKSIPLMNSARKIEAIYLNEETMNRTEYVVFLKLKSIISPELITGEDKLYLLDIIFDDYEDDLIYYSREILRDETLINKLLERSQKNHSKIIKLKGNRKAGKNNERSGKS